MNQRALGALLVLLSATAPALANAVVYTRYVWSLNNRAPDTANATFAICQVVPGDLPCPASPGAAMTPIISANPVAYQLFGRVGGSAMVTPTNGGYRVNVSQSNSSVY